jgi:TusA-related sulfurtransferase
VYLLHNWVCSMAEITFKKFNTFIDTAETLHDEQINEIFGFFNNDAKLEKLKAEKERLKAERAAKGKAIDRALMNMKNGKKLGVISDDDIAASMNDKDRKFIDKMDHAAMDNRKKDLKDLEINGSEVPKVIKLEHPGWYVINHDKKAVRGPFQTGEAKRISDEMNAKSTGKKYDTAYFSDTDIKKMTEGSVVYKIVNAEELQELRTEFSDDVSAIADALFERANGELQSELMSISYEEFMQVVHEELHS